MNRLSPLASAIVSVMSVGAVPCFAQPASDSPLTGSVSLGVRNVEVGGAVTKYREDVNLDDGVRLFDLRLRYAPQRDAESIVDRIDLNASNLGGDPYESISLSVQKYGAYNLKLDHRRSEYFYEDTIVPAALASIESVTGGDFHTFDFERVRDTASLDLTLSPDTKLSFGLERQTRTGDSTTTLDIQRDEFELDRPIDESLNALTAGIQHSWDKVTVVFQEEIKKFENTNEMFLPGASAGTNPLDPADLQFFFLDQSYDFDSQAHLIRVLANPTTRFQLRAALRREDLDLDMDASERSDGIDFTGAPFATDLSGAAIIGRDLDFDEVDFEFNANERLRLVGGVRSSSLDQRGSLIFGPDAGAGAWEIDTDGLEIGVEFAARANLLFSVGLSNEERDSAGSHAFVGAQSASRIVTDRDGFFARARYESEQGLELTASIEENSIDNPFALASATDNIRYKLGIRHRWDNGVSLTGSHRRTDVENDNSGWASDTEQTAIRLSYRDARLQVSGGFTSVDTARSVDQLVTAGLRQNLFLISYTADSTFVDASARWLVNDRISIGGEVRRYENDGSFALDRDDFRAFVDVRLTDDYSLELAYREFDYLEDTFDDYDAEILQVAIRLDW
ncbi:MAG: hypothetical protein OEQ25_05105 [Gammaproteobacteria bacterium]|nr:hypothetical protein [Gammaproteobacteria bacterium]MDH3506502.1 hypothetical protein [Gammaproteobacteria bacterium]